MSRYLFSQLKDWLESGKISWILSTCLSEPDNVALTTNMALRTSASNKHCLQQTKSATMNEMGLHKITSTEKVYLNLVKEL